MAKGKANPEAAGDTSPAEVAVRLSSTAPFGRVVVGNVVIERDRPQAGWPTLPHAELERLAEEYGLEAVPLDEV